MKKLLLGFAAVLIGTALLTVDAEARRLGGGKPIGTQRSVTNTPPAQTPGKPAQAQQAAPAQGAAAAPAAAQPSGLSRWMPMLGGLALGGMLGYLMGANGMGGLLMGIMLVALLAFAGVFIVRMLMQKKGEQSRPLQYAGMGNETVAAPPPSQAAGFDTGAAARPAVQVAGVPDGFDVAGFLKGAKLNYMKLQMANDRGDMDALREFTSPELFEELKADILGRDGGSQHTDVLALNADLLEVATEGERHWASVRFSGTIRESAAGATEGFEEVWNLAKPVDGSGGWVLSGIQQMH